MSACYDDEWVYRGVRCVIETDWDESDRWVYHVVELPDGQIVSATGISPRDHSRSSVEAWIDERIRNETD